MIYHRLHVIHDQGGVQHRLIACTDDATAPVQALVVAQQGQTTVTAEAQVLQLCSQQF